MPALILLQVVFLEGAWKDQVRIHGNKAALVTAAAIVVCSFALPTPYGSSLAGFFDARFSGPLSFESAGDLAFLTAFSFFILSLALYTTDGLGFISSRFSRYASYMTILLFLSLLYNQFLSPSDAGSALTPFISPISSGIGIWILPLIGILYLAIFEKISPDKTNPWKLATFVLILILVLFTFGVQNPVRDSLQENIDAWQTAVQELPRNPVPFSTILPVRTPAPTPMSTIAIPPTTRQRISTIPATRPSGTITSEIELAILRLTNEERSSYGLRALIWDDALASVARDHSRDMAANDFFSHINPAGEDPTDRAERHGYPTTKSLGGGAYLVGIAENIAKMPTGHVEGIGYVAPDADSISIAIIQGWMDSPGHRENILSSKPDRIGVGVAYDGRYYLATQNFW